MAQENLGLLKKLSKEGDNKDEISKKIKEYNVPLEEKLLLKSKELEAASKASIEHDDKEKFNEDKRAQLFKEFSTYVKQIKDENHRDLMERVFGLITTDADHRKKNQKNQ